jgi:hypothetical protein
MAPRAAIIVPTGPKGRPPGPIQSVVARGICGICASAKIAGPVCLVLLSLALQGCTLLSNSL